MANPLKKTMVYLGLADEELQPETTATASAAPVAPVSHGAPASGTRAPVTPLRRGAGAHNTAPAEMNEIVTVHPKQYRDAQAIAESFRNGVPVIINLSQMTEPDARRLIDFASGLSQGLVGKIERVTNKVFLLSPAHVAISGDHEARDVDADASFFARS